MLEGLNKDGKILLGDIEGFVDLKKAVKKATEKATEENFIHLQKELVELELQALKQNKYNLSELTLCRNEPGNFQGSRIFSDVEYYFTQDARNNKEKVNVHYIDGFFENISELQKEYFSGMHRPKVLNAQINYNENILLVDSENPIKAKHIRKGVYLISGNNDFDASSDFKTIKLGPSGANFNVGVSKAYVIQGDSLFVLFGYAGANGGYKVAYTAPNDINQLIANPIDVNENGEKYRREYLSELKDYFPDCKKLLQERKEKFYLPNR